MDTKDADITEGAGKSFLNVKAAILVIFFSGVFGSYFFIGDQYLSFEALSKHHRNLLEWSRDNRGLAIVVFILAYVTVVSLSLPGALWMTLGGGLIFGPAMATALVVSSATFGASIIFLLARYTLSDFFYSKMGSKTKEMAEKFNKNALSYILFLRLVPVFPFWFVNVAPAFFRVPLQTYFIGTFVGIIPGSAIYCSVGNGLGSLFDSGAPLNFANTYGLLELVGPLLALGFLALLPIFYKNGKLKKVRKLGANRNDSAN